MYNKGNTAHNAKYNNPEYIGKTFGKLTVLDISHSVNGKYNRWIWKCMCECGTVKEYRGEYVCNGHTTSCGCFLHENQPNRRHGESGTRLFTIWNHMLTRCDPEKVKEHNYSRYGGRGIRVCDAWKDYTVFAEWARANGYQDNLSIERIDNDGNYCPENCTWVDKKAQARNRSTTMIVEYSGKKMSLAEACEMVGMPYKQVYSRIKYSEWPVEDALRIPINETRKWKRSERFCNR